MQNDLTIFVAGATGATGRLLVARLLEAGCGVKAVVRSPARLPEDIRDHERLSVIHAGILDLSAAELATQVRGCQAVASCLGHNLTFKGVFGPPRKLVTDAAKKLCAAIKANAAAKPVRFVLMNTTGNRNRDLDERVSLPDRAAIALLRGLLPPQADNEHAAEFLRTEIGQNDRKIEWTAVRPDNLVDESAVTEYQVHASPVRGVIFGAGKTSRINVAHFMTRLMIDDQTWRRWKGQMPVVYNETSS